MQATEVVVVVEEIVDVVVVVAAIVVVVPKPGQFPIIGDDSPQGTHVLQPTVWQ